MSKTESTKQGMSIAFSPNSPFMRQWSRTLYSNLLWTLLTCWSWPKLKSMNNCLHYLLSLGRLHHFVSGLGRCLEVRSFPATLRNTESTTRVIFDNHFRYFKLWWGHNQKQLQVQFEPRWWYQYRVISWELVHISRYKYAVVRQRQIYILVTISVTDKIYEKRL